MHLDVAEAVVVFLRIDEVVVDFLVAVAIYKGMNKYMKDI